MSAGAVPVPGLNLNQDNNEGRPSALALGPLPLDLDGMRQQILQQDPSALRWNVWSDMGAGAGTGNGQRISPGYDTLHPHQQPPPPQHQHQHQQQNVYAQPQQQQGAVYSMPQMNGMYHQQLQQQQQQQQLQYNPTPVPLLTTARAWDPYSAAPQQQQQTVNPPRACVRCKRLKVRCENVNGTRPCKRCRNANHECVTAQRKQRPKKGEHRVGVGAGAEKSSPSVGEHTPDSPSEESSEAECGEEDDTPDPDAGDVLSPFSWIKGVALEKSSTTTSSSSTTTTSSTSTTTTTITTSTAAAASPPAANPKPAKKVGISRNWFVNNPGGAGQGEAKAEKMEILNVVTASEVEMLFKSFMDKINPYMSMFDEKLHTLQYVKSKSPFLLTVMVTIAARFYTTRPDAYVRLMDITKKLAGEAIVNMTKSIEHCQAFILLASYPAPDRKYSENRNWLYSGVAFRMATDLSLHRPQPALPSPSAAEKQEMLEREALNRTRTWIVCFYLDESMSAHFGRPATIRDDAVVRNAMSWWRRSAYNHVNDLHVCLFVELLRIFRRYLDMGQNAEDDAVARGDAQPSVDYFAMSRAFDEEVDRWETMAQELFEQTDRRNPVCILRERLCDFTTQYARLIIHSTGFQKGQPVPQGQEDVCLERCLQAAFRVLEIVMRDIHATGTLRYGCDGYFWYCSFASAFLLKFLGPDHSAKVDEATRMKIVAYVQELIGVLGSRDVAVDASHPPKLFSRFLSGMLAKHVKQAAAAHTPSSSAAPAAPSQTQNQGQTSPTTTMTDHAPTPALTASSPVEPLQQPPQHHQHQQHQEEEWPQQQQFAGFEGYDYAPAAGVYAEQDEMMKDVSPHELNTGMFILDHPPWWHDPSFSMDFSALAMDSGAAPAPAFEQPAGFPPSAQAFGQQHAFDGGTAAFQM